MTGEKKKKPSFWTRVAQSLKRKITKEDAKRLHAALWGTKRAIADHKGRMFTLTNGGQVVSARRDMRREAARAGLAKTGRQWTKLRKQMSREERKTALPTNPVQLDS